MKANLLFEEVYMKPLNIVILDGYTLNPDDLNWDGFARLGKVTVHDRTTPEEIRPRIRDAQIVITNRTPLIAETLAPPMQIGIC